MHGKLFKKKKINKNIGTQFENWLKVVRLKGLGLGQKTLNIHIFLLAL
jgi:hypothetical protein